MRVLCGGRIAEQRKTNDVSSGAAMDIRMATIYARHMILEWGMSDRLGFVNYAGDDTRDYFMPERGYSEDTARIIDEEIKRLTDEAYADAERIISENWSMVIAIAEALLKYETLTADDVARLMRGEQMAKPTVAELLRQESKKAEKMTAAPGKPYEEEETGEEDTGGMMPSPA